MYSSFAKYIENALHSGGEILFFLAICALISWVLILERYLYFSSNTVLISPHQYAWKYKILELQDHLERLIYSSRKNKDPSGQIAYHVEVSLSSLYNSLAPKLLPFNMLTHKRPLDYVLSECSKLVISEYSQENSKENSQENSQEKSNHLAPQDSYSQKNSGQPRLLAHWDPQKEALFEEVKNRAISEKIGEMERSVNLQASLGNISPYIGLLGTLFGIIRAFSGLGTEGFGASGSLSLNSELYKGIAEALVATAAGLIVAIPASFAYNLFQKKIRDRLRSLDILLSFFKTEWIKKTLRYPPKVTEKHGQK